MARAAVAAVVVVGLVLGSAVAAGAHALRVASSPGAGQVLKTSPSQVVVTFGEQPDPHLSHLRVLDTSGQDETSGPTTAVPGHPVQLEVPVRHLGTGVYSVVWTTVSAVDGHLASGTFAFGVGVSTTAIPAARTTSSGAGQSWVTAASRWLLYAGLMGQVGAAAVLLICLGRTRRPVWPWTLAGAWVVALVGAAGIALSQAATDHVAVGHLFSASLGRQLGARALPLLVGGLAALVAWLVGRRSWGGRAAVAVLGLAGLAAMWGDVSDSHAAAAHRASALKMVEQWLHIASAGVWIGGLVAVVVLIVGLAAAERGPLVARFSTLALGSVVVLAASGVLRAIDELGSWHALWGTEFGRLLLVKSALLAVLVGLGALNRYRSVPRLDGAVGGSDPPVARSGSARPLLALSRVELGIAAVVLVATAVLQGLAPPASVASTPAPPHQVVSGSDYAQTVRVRLTITPGTTGFNQFVLAADDTDTGKPVVASPVQLTFSLPADPSLGHSTLTLKRASDGTYTGSGPNLSLDGTWHVAVLLQQPTSSVEVDLQVHVRPPPEHITVQHSPGIPDLYTISLTGGGNVQVYLDPGRRGFNEFHTTYVTASGQEVPMASLAVSARGPTTSSASRSLPVRRLDAIGHFVADLAGAGTGRYTFALVGVSKAGVTYRSSVTIPVG